jgi:hypothetical protein
MTRENVLPAEGNYPAIIKGFGSILLSKRRPGVFILPIFLNTNDNIHCTSYVSGYLSSIRMILATKDNYIGKQVTVRIRHRSLDDVITYISDILWEVKV